MDCTHIVGPGAGYVGEPLDAAADLHVLVSREEVLKTSLDVRSYPRQSLSAQDHAGSSHAEVLVVLEAQQSELLLVTTPRLPQEVRFPRVQGSQEELQLVRFDVDVVICAEEPLEAVSEVLPHVLQHQEALLLWRIGIVHGSQAD